MVLTGLDKFEKGFWKKLKGKALGLVANQASVDRNLNSGTRVINSLLPGHLKALFGPQHGFRGEEQDNMVESEEYIDPELNLPVFTLYGSKKGKLFEVMDSIDLFLIDLQDVGTRVYTFASTLLYCLRQAADSDKEIIILDRPNPLGGTIVEGNILRPEFYSIVGPFSIPMRHGMTMGELAKLFNDAFKIGCDIKVVSAEGWSRYMLWKDTGLRWIMPSPNMPFAETAQVYPGQVLWEGTNVSEGRGTCRPFEIFGAPFIDPYRIKNRLSEKDMAGAFLQEQFFRPTFHKWEGRLCGGFMIYITDPQLFRPFRTSLALLKNILEEYRDEFSWRQPPYEFEYTRLPIDMILGDPAIRVSLEGGRGIDNILNDASEELEAFLESRRPYLIYGPG